MSPVFFFFLCVCKLLVDHVQLAHPILPKGKTEDNK